MPFSQAENPTNFYTATSTQLLDAPEPQFLYADLFIRAIGASLPVPADLGVAPAGTGAPYGSAEDGRLILADPISTSLFSVNVDFTGQPGSSIRVNRPAYVDTTYTASSRIVPSGATITTTPAPSPGGQQANLTLERYAGPYDTVNSRVAPYLIDNFDNQLGIHSGDSIHSRHLVRDFHKTLDSFMVTLLDLGSTAVYPVGVSTVDQMNTLGDYPFSLEQLTRTERLMDEAHLPVLPDGRRILVLTARQVADLGLDSNYMKLSEAHPQFNRLFPQYVKAVAGFHIFKSTTLSQTANSSSVAVQYGHAIAPGCLMGGMGRAPRIAPSDLTNHGESKMVVWIAYLALALANNAFVLSVRSA
jgi:hypothetical protein